MPVHKAQNGRTLGPSNLALDGLCLPACKPRLAMQAGTVRELRGIRLQPTSRSGSLLATGGRRTLTRVPASSRWAAVRSHMCPICILASLWRIAATCFK